MIFNPVVQGGGWESVFEPDGNNSFRFQKTSPVGTVDVAYQDVSGIEKTFNLAYAGTKTVNDWCPGNEMTITIMDTSGHSVANLDIFQN